MPADTRPSAIAVMGPTAAGKSTLALEWAERFNGEIISVDSAQVYRGLNIGAAKPDVEEQLRVPHHLLDVCDPWQPYSAAEFARDAADAIDGILARGRLPILVGGTGLYFRALLRGLSPMPEADPEVRAEISAQAHARGWPALHAELAIIDPDAATRIQPSDPQRIQRALEVWRLSAKPLSDWQRLPPVRPKLPVRILKLIMAPGDRATLHVRIAQRLDMMLAAGFLDEVRALRVLPELATHPSPLDLPALRAVGYRQAWEHLDGGYDASEFRNRVIDATCQLAKRQLTWLRRELDARWFDPLAHPDGLERVLGLFMPPGHP